MIKDILVNLSAGEKRDVAADYAVSMAATLQAHLCGVAFVHEPVVPGSLFEGVSASIVSTYRAESKNTAQAAVKRFEEAARGAGIASEAHVITASIDGVADTFGRLARRYDLVVVRQPDPDADSSVDEVMVEAALFGSGRPVLAVPYIQREGFKVDRVLLCWDGGRHAARAFGDALPLLERSKAIHVLTIASKDSKKGEISGADIAHHLARHRLKVELKNVVAPDSDVASTILSTAADISADLIVMGGYGHSRMREFVLGGATRGILSAMTAPTLMSH